MTSQKTKLCVLLACILVFIISTSAQTFQYSKGWEPGRKRADDQSFQYRDWSGEKRAAIRGLKSRRGWEELAMRKKANRNQAELRELMRIASE